jgi:hypothetical protein
MAADADPGADAEIPTRAGGLARRVRRQKRPAPGRVTVATAVFTANDHQLRGVLADLLAFGPAGGPAAEAR